MKILPTARGFKYGRFTDKYGSECSIQDSSIASEPCIWLGVDKSFEGNECTRMHLTQDHVKELLPLLKAFLKNGSID